MTDNELDLNGHWTIDPGHSRCGFSARKKFGTQNHRTGFGSCFALAAYIRASVGVNSGLTKEEYDKLSKIAPTVAYPKVAWGTSW